MLPRTGSHLPAWRQQVAPWIMACVRLAVGWFVTRYQLQALVVEPTLLGTVAATWTRWGLAALLVLGALLFAWPRSYLLGAAVLIAAFLAFEWLWRALGMSAGPMILYSSALVAVLAIGEWAVRRVQRRVYAARLP